MRQSVASAEPSAMACSAIARQAAGVPLPMRKSIFAASESETSRRSAGPSPRSTAADSRTSMLLPMPQPSGTSISVMSATVRLPAASPMATIVCARRMASSCVFMNAPEPVLTSSRMALAPAASFLLMMEDAMSGMLSTVAVTSRSA